MLERQPSVLRPTLYRDIQARDHLDARGHRTEARSGERQRAAEHSVDTPANQELSLRGLQMDVTGTQRHRSVEDVVYQSNDGRRVRDRMQGSVVLGVHLDVR